MFVVPEALWSSAGNFYYQFIKGMSVSNVPPFRLNFLQSPDNMGLLKFVIFVQTLGLALALIYVFKLENKLLKWISATVLSIIFLLLAFILLYAFNLL